MSFRGLRDYRTDPPGLRSDLQRQNTLLEAELASIRNDMDSVPTPLFVFRDTQAAAGQLVLADATRGVITVTLPSKGSRVLVAKTDGTGNAVNVTPADEQSSINGTPGAESIAARGLREYFGDGQGNWWRR